MRDKYSLCRLPVTESNRNKYMTFEVVWCGNCCCGFRFYLRSPFPSHVSLLRALALATPLSRRLRSRRFRGATVCVSPFRSDAADSGRSAGSAPANALIAAAPEGFAEFGSCKRKEIIESNYVQSAGRRSKRFHSLFKQIHRLQVRRVRLQLHQRARVRVAVVRIHHEVGLLSITFTFRSHHEMKLRCARIKTYIFQKGFGDFVVFASVSQRFAELLLKCVDFFDVRKY